MLTRIFVSPDWNRATFCDGFALRGLVVAVVSLRRLPVDVFGRNARLDEAFADMLACRRLTQKAIVGLFSPSLSHVSTMSAVISTVSIASASSSSSIFARDGADARQVRVRRSVGDEVGQVTQRRSARASSSGSTDRRNTCPGRATTASLTAR